MALSWNEIEEIWKKEKIGEKMYSDLYTIYVNAWLSVCNEKFNLPAGFFPQQPTFKVG